MNLPVSLRRHETSRLLAESATFFFRQSQYVRRCRALASEEWTPQIVEVSELHRHRDGGNVHLRSARSAKQLVESSRLAEWKALRFVQFRGFRIHSDGCIPERAPESGYLR